MNKYYPEHLAPRNTNNYSVQEIESLRDTSSIVYANVISCKLNLDLIIDLGDNLVGVLPFSRLEYNKDSHSIKDVSAKSKVGRTVAFKIDSLTNDLFDGKKVVILDRSAAQKECYDNYISKMACGDVLDAYVVGAESYGLFCDIGVGLISLMPISSVSVVHYANPKKELHNLGHIKCIFVSNENGKITISHKELLGSWEQESASITSGDTVIGIVRKIESYGVFVELTPNLVGLANNYRGIAVGDTVSVYIRSKNTEKRKIKLSILKKIDKSCYNKKYQYYMPSNNKIVQNTGSVTQQ